MNKKKYPPTSDQDQFPTFLDIQQRVFTQVGDDVYIGTTKIDPALRSLLRDEAKYIQQSRLWEILNASVMNESYTLALNQSQNWENVQFAKGMYQWAKYMINVLHLLSK